MPHPLVLRANPEGWRSFVGRRQQESFKQNAPKIWQRDHYRCQFCGYQGKRFQEIVNLDGNYRHNVPSNLVTACSLCAHCLFLGAQGLGHKLIYLPHLTQVQLNQLVRVLFCAMDSGSAFAETAKALYRNMVKFSEPIEEIFGKGSSDYEVFGQSLVDTPNIDPNKYMEVMKYVRLLPSAKPFGEQIQYWSRSVIPQLLTTEDFAPGGMNNA
jgi:intracellular multiplication protein IcmJ